MNNEPIGLDLHFELENQKELDTLTENLKNAIQALKDFKPRLKLVKPAPEDRQDQLYNY